MDELALLRDFRLDDAEPRDAREHAHARLTAMVARHRRRRRGGFFALALVAAAIVAGAAYGVVRELVIGDPAPEEIKQTLARFGHEAELIPYPRPDDPRVQGAEVAAVLDSSVGSVYLFRVPTARTLCAWVWIEGQRGYQGMPELSGVCGAPRETFFGLSRQPVGGGLVRLLAGRVSDEVTRVTVRFAERTVDVPLTGRWFFAELSEDPTVLVTYDAAGRLVDQHEISQTPPQGTPIPQPKQVGEAHKVAEISARDGEAITLEVAQASDGGYCTTVRSDRRRPNSGCSTPRQPPREIGVSAMNLAGAPGGVLLLVGPVGSDIARLELRYEDGRVAPVPLNKGWVLFEVEPADYVQGRRPETLIAHDASGQEIATQRLPWANRGG